MQKPALDKVGAFDLETFYPAKERLQLAMAINNLLASPGFAAWLSGEPLDVQRLLFTPAGKPRIVVISTGSELREPGSQLGFDSIYDANSYLLAAQARAADAIAYRVGIVTEAGRCPR